MPTREHSSKTSGISNSTNNRAKIPDVPVFPPSPSAKTLSTHVRRLRGVKDVLKRHRNISSSDANLIRDWINLANRKTTAHATAELVARCASLLLKALCIGLREKGDSINMIGVFNAIPGLMEKMEEIEKMSDPTEGDVEEIRKQIESVDAGLDMMMDELKIRDERKNMNEKD